MQAHKTLAHQARAELIVKHSRFIGIVAPVETEDEARMLIEQTRAEHPSATHVCYAYRIKEGNRERYSDDGEPQSTAGRPILFELASHELVNVICLVVRYFGGTLLGKGSLMRAYTQSTQAALAETSIISMQPVIHLSIEVEYSHFETIKHLASNAGGHLMNAHFGSCVLLDIDFLSGTQEAFLSEVQELLGVSREELSVLMHEELCAWEETAVTVETAEVDGLNENTQ